MLTSAEAVYCALYHEQTMHQIRASLGRRCFTVSKLNIYLTLMELYQKDPGPIRSGEPHGGEVPREAPVVLPDPLKAAREVVRVATGQHPRRVNRLQHLPDL